MPAHPGPLKLVDEQPGVIKPDTPQLDAASPLEGLQARQPKATPLCSPTEFAMAVFGHVPRRKRD